MFILAFLMQRSYFANHIFIIYNIFRSYLTLIEDELDIDGIKLTFEQIEETLFNFGKNREWDSKLAKWTRTGRTAEQSLLAHALNTYSVAKKLSLRLAEDIGLSNFDILIVLIACF